MRPVVSAGLAMKSRILRRSANLSVTAIQVDGEPLERLDWTVKRVVLVSSNCILIANLLLLSCDNQVLVA
jgi:hypothetical protein